MGGAGTGAPAFGGKDMSETLEEGFARVRADSENFCNALQVEDYGLQAMAETSPPKWHLAHTSWFFETFILKPHVASYQAWNPAFEVLFNSYYNGIGPQYPRAERGLLSRPSVAEVLDYRHHVTAAIRALLSDDAHPEFRRIAELVELGMHHERQHQELFFTDIKYSLSRNPLYPAYLAERLEPSPVARPQGWLEHPGGEVRVGHLDTGFCFDNEQPEHSVLLQPFALADRLVTNGEYLAFIEDGGYTRADLWLSDGWSTVRERGWQAPLYWSVDSQGWCEYTLYGLQQLDPARPVLHVSAYEADAYARWAGARLPGEFEWEALARSCPLSGQFVEAGALHPRACVSPDETQLHGCAWEWTASAYSAYPGYRPAPGAVGEYNGKFMANQLVLRGGSCVTSEQQMRYSYRNFFYPPDRWQFSGIRLAQWL